MWLFRSAVLAFAVVLGITPAGASAQAQANPQHPMSVLNERISQIGDEIARLQAFLSAMTLQERSDAAEEIYKLVLRLSYLKASKVHMKDLPEEKTMAVIEYVLAPAASPSRP